MLALLLVAVFALKKTNVIPGHHNYEIEKPVQRTEEEVQKKLEEMAKKHREYKDILEHYEDYPETYLAALANNPEMLDYVKGYLDSHGVLDAKLTKSEKKEDYPLFINGISVGDMLLMEPTVSESPDADRPACPW